MDRQHTAHTHDGNDAQPVEHTGAPQLGIPGGVATAQADRSESPTSQIPVLGAPAAPADGDRPKPRWASVKNTVIAAVAAVVVFGGGFAVVRAANSSGLGSQGPGGQGPGGQMTGQFPGGPPGFGQQNGAVPGGQQPGGQPRGGQPPGGLMPGGVGGAGVGPALHGETVTSNGSGNYTTIRFQTGTVTAASSSSLTVKSSDGFTATYTLTSSTTVNGGSPVSSVATGHTVTVTATVSGGKATANTILDRSLGQATGQQGQPGA